MDLNDKKHSNFLEKCEERVFKNLYIETIFIIRTYLYPAITQPIY